MLSLPDTDYGDKIMMTKYYEYLDRYKSKPKYELVAIKKALSFAQVLNTEDEDARLKAVSTLLKRA